MIDRVDTFPTLRSPTSIEDRRTLDRQHSFGSLLTAERFKKDGEADAESLEAAKKLVAHALVLPILKQFRETNQAAAPFAPNQAEKAFGSVMDQEMASRLVSSGWGLVEAVARRLRATPVEGLPQADLKPS